MRALTMLTEIAVTLWFAIGFLMVMGAASRSAFGTRRGWFVALLCEIGFAFVWPLAMPSAAGRRRIVKSMKEWMQ